MASRTTRPLTIDTLRADEIRRTLRARRVELGLTQAELAENMGVSGSMISYLEIDSRSTPNLVTVIAWARGLGLRLDCL